MSSGYDIDVIKDVSIEVPPGTTIDIDSQWVRLYRWTALPEGPSIIEAEISAILPNPRPTDIQTRLLRNPNTAPDPTKRRTHSVGSIKAWADVTTYLEFIREEDLPIDLQMWQKGTAALQVVKVIPKVYTPTFYVSEKLR